MSTRDHDYFANGVLDVCVDLDTADFGAVIVIQREGTWAKCVISRDDRERLASHLGKPGNTQHEDLLFRLNSLLRGWELAASGAHHEAAERLYSRIRELRATIQGPATATDQEGNATNV